MSPEEGRKMYRRARRLGQSIDWGGMDEEEWEPPAEAADEASDGSDEDVLVELTCGKPWWRASPPGEFEDEKEPDAEEQAALDLIRRDYGPPPLLERWLAYHRLMHPEPTAHERRSAGARKAAHTRAVRRAERAAAVAEAEAIIRAAQQ
jgi:hypothetical protein